MSPIELILLLLILMVFAPVVELIGLWSLIALASPLLIPMYLLNSVNEYKEPIDQPVGFKGKVVAGVLCLFIASMFLLAVHNDIWKATETQIQIRQMR